MASYTYGEPLPGDLGAGGKPCKCCRLISGLDLPVPKQLEVEQIRPIAQTFAHSIFSDWVRLNATLKRFETTIQKRWLKKSAKQRREVLVSANPQIPLVHRPDFESFRHQNNRRIARDKTCGADAHLTPYINLEDLLQGHNLLLFLTSRGRNQPVLFASTDAEKAHLSHGWKRTPDPDGYAMAFFGKQTPRLYGGINKVSALPRRIGAIQSHDPTFGLLVLEIQQNIYSFLLACTRHILHDFHPSQYLLAPHQTAPRLPQSSPGSWESVSKQIIEADYQVPGEASLDRIRLLVNGRRLAAQDQICLLREDPGYFLESLRDWREYYDTCGLEDPDVDIWRHVAAHMIANFLDSLHSWTWLSKMLSAMRPLSEQIRLADRNRYRLQQGDELCWVLLSKAVDEMIKKPMDNMELTVPRSSRLRGALMQAHNSDWCKLQSKCPSPHGCESDWNIKITATPAQHQVHRIFRMLAGLDPEGVSLHELRPIVQEANYMLETDSEARDLIDPYIMTDFFDLAVLADLQHCIASFHPFSKAWVAAGMEDDVYVSTGLEDSFYTKRDILLYAANRGCLQAKTLDNPLDGRFCYPIEKRRTAETVKQMQRAEVALKKYWDELSLAMWDHGVFLEAMLQCHLSDGFRVKAPKTKDWKQTPTAVFKPVSPPSDDFDNHDNSLASPSGKENKKTELSPEERTKTKTRGKADPQEASPPNHHETPATTDSSSPPILLPRRVFKVMCALLPSATNISQTPREVAWEELLYAFYALGLVPEKLYGSVWIFKPVPAGQGLVNVERSIQFHEPKEVRRGNKVSPLMVKRLGDRLKRAFGWDGETFGCA